MPGITAVCIQDTAWVFYNTESQHLAVQLHPLGPRASSSQNAITTFAAQPAVARGAIRNPSCLAATMYRDVPFVVGVHNHPTLQDQSHVDLLSPATLRIASDVEAASSSSVAMCASDDGTAAWVSFVKDNTLQIANSPAFKPFPHPGIEPREGSALASWALGRQKWVIYSKVLEGEDYDKVFEYDVLDQKEKHVDTIQEPSKRTSLAVVYVPANNKVFLYFAAFGRRLLRRVIKHGDQWGDPVTIYSRSANNSDEKVENRIANNSQISVVHHDNKNHIFLTRNGETAITHIMDDKLED